MTSAPFSSSQIASFTVVADAASRLDALDQIRRRQPEMEADDFGLQLLHHGAKGGIERRAVGGVDGSGGIKPKLLVVGPKPRLPAGFALRIGVHDLVAEEVQVDWRRYALANNVDLFTRLFCGQHCARQRSQRSALRGGDHQLRIHHTRHRRQHDREFCLDEVEETAVRPHGFSLRFG
jgi:hypothetical protein